MLSKTRITTLAAIAAVAVLAIPTAHAEDEFEIGGFGGLHLFSENNELGVADEENAVSPENSFIMGLRLAVAVHPLAAIEGEAGFLPSKVRDTDAELLALAYRLQGVLHFGPLETKLRPFVLAGFGGMYGKSSEMGIFAGDSDSDSDFVFHGGAGVKYRMGDKWGLRVDLRLLLPPSSSSDSATVDFEGLAALYSTFPSKKAPPPPKDTDGDGINDPEDSCPEQPEDADGFQDTDGCPEPDNDGDGIPDTDDKCSNEPEDKDGFEDTDGCPETDNDGDGIPDDADKCPLEAEDKDSFQDEDGCPELDNDADGLPDQSDQCVNEPEDKDGFQDEDGCPDFDNDGDGVRDEADKCPTELETKNGYEDDDGCPDTIPRQVQRFTGVIRGIVFETGKAVIRRQSFFKLDQAVKVLTQYPSLRLEISGHTDNTGTDEINRELSKQRAQAVKDYFVSKGVAADRLEAKGYGPDQPIATNKTKFGRSKNRRVEFKLLSNLIQGDPPAENQPEAPAPAPQPDATP